MSDDQSNDGKVVDINQGKSNKNPKKGKAKSGEASEKKIRFGVIAKYLCDFIDGLPLHLGKEYAPFQHKFVTYQEKSKEPKIILERHETTRTVEEVSEQRVVDCLTQRTSNFIDVPAEVYNLSQSRLFEVVAAWKSLSIPIRGFPSAVGFKSQPIDVFTRLDFDPQPIIDELELEEKCPIFSEILSRLTNKVAFCARLGSLFDENADRKQILWVYGPGDAGKSQISWMVQELVGNSVAILSPAILKSPFWKATVVGKRVAIDSDATPHFLQSDEFKSFTGDGKHSINQKNKPIYTANINCQGLFFSNNPAFIDNSDSLKNRIIVCHIDSLPPEKMEAEHIFREKLRLEFPYIVGYCQEVYDYVGRGRRIPSDPKALQECIDSYESTDLAIFDRNFEEKPDGAVSNEAFYDILIREGKNRQKDQREFKEFLKNRFSITETSVKRGGKTVRVIKGIAIRLNRTSRTNPF